MHTVELERKLRLPDPAKTMETVWKLLKRTRQRLDTSVAVTQPTTGPSPDLVALERKNARLVADHRRSQGVSYSRWTIIK